MRLYVNLRGLVLSILALALLGGAGAGYWWWVNRPDYLLASARTSYAEAEAKRAAEDDAGAKAAYEYADQQLQNLLRPDKSPANSQALMLRYHVLVRLSALLAKEEDRQGITQGRPSAALAQEAWVCADRAAKLDEKHAEAHATMMTAFIREEKIARAEPYAARLIQIAAGENSDGDWPNYASQQAAARFVLAWSALHVNAVPQPQAALAHLKAAAELEARGAEGRPAAEAQQPLPRWRSVALEAQALALLADPPKQAGTAAASREARQERDEALEQLRTRMPLWLARARAEKDQPLPPEGTVPMPPTVASMAVTPSPSDLPGVLDVLGLSVTFATDPAQVLERTELMLAVCDKLCAGPKGPTLSVIREIALRVASLPETVSRRVAHLARVEKQPSLNLARSAKWKELGERIEKFGELALERDSGADPESYLKLARYAQRENRRDNALRFSAKGIDLIERTKRHLPANVDVTIKEQLTKIEMGLRSLAAWILIVQNKPAEAEKHLAILRDSGSKHFAAEAHLMEGLLAVQEGRLETGVRELEIARQYSLFNDSLYPHLGLAYAYMALGKYDRALGSLDRVQHYFQKYDQLGDEEKAVADQLVPSPTALNLEYFRCHLALGNLREAASYKEALKDVPEEHTASALLINHYLAQANNATQPAQRAAALQNARDELEAARRLAPQDLRLVWAEVNLILSEPQSNPALAASAAAALLLPPVHVGNHVVENLRLYKGLAWEVEKAEQHLWKRTSAIKNIDARLAWVRWLLLRGRHDEADALLARLEQLDFPQYKRALQFYRAEVLLARGQQQEVADLIRLIEADKDDLQSDLLSVRFYAETANDPAQAEQKLMRALNRHERSGQLYLLQGQLAQSRSDFKQAARSYGRSLQFAAFRVASQRGLLASLLGLMSKESPEAASDLTAELLRAHPNDPALLLAYAEAAVLLDNVYGDQGMEGALRALDGVCREQFLNAAQGPYFLARGWVAAARPDLARRELARALQADPRHEPSLTLAGQLDLRAEDWDACLKHAAALEAVRPDLAEPLRWRALALENLGRVTEAQDVCQTLMRKFPGQPAGYLTLAGILERAQDYAGAARWVGRWRERAPGHLDGIEAQARLLARTGRPAEVNESAEQTIRLQARKPNARPEETAAAAVAIALSVAQGLASGQAFDQAEAWSQRAVEMARQLPEKPRQEWLLAAELCLGQTYLLRSQAENWPLLRLQSASKAVEVYRAIYERLPGHLIAGNNLAWLLNQELGETEAALAVAERVRQGRHSKKPVSGERLPVEFLETLAGIYREAQRPEDAVRLFKEATRRYSLEPRIHLHLGRAYATMKGYRAAAIESLNKAARLAAERADNTADPQRKAQWMALAEEARRDQESVVASR